MKILVTGATGFIGQYIVKYLLSLGVDVTATGARSPDEAKLLFGTNKKLNYIQKDLSEKEENYYSFFTSPDILIHSSWMGLPNYNELFHIERNLPANYYFIKNMISNGLQDLTVIGTCFEYGLQNGKLDENINTNPCTVYGLAKDALRKCIEVLQFSYKFNLKWIRLFYLFGAGQGPKSLYTQMEDAVNNNCKEFNMSLGEQLRDYLPVSLVAEYIVKSAVQQKIQGIVNCCSGKPISVRSFVESFFRENNHAIKLNLGYYPYPNYEPLAFWGDNTKLQLIIKERKE
jgi:dTDP-6-deoxy-L-talose 4-dehydrogenase (NAD+)